MATTSFSKKEKEAAERKAKSRKRKQRKLKIITTLVVVLIMSVAAVCALSLTVLFKIETINVSGSTTYTAEEVITAAGIAVGDNLIRVSKNSLSENLQKTLPFIDEVVVEKQFPGILNISVKETKEELVFKNSKAVYTANREGKILKKYSEYNGDLMFVKVSDKALFNEGETILFENEREKELCFNFISMIFENGYDVEFVNVSDPFSSYMKFEDRIIAKFGSASYFENKAAYFKAGVKGISEKAEGVFDLSAWTPENNKPVLTYGDISSYEK